MPELRSALRLPRTYNVMKNALAWLRGARVPSLPGPVLIDRRVRLGPIATFPLRLPPFVRENRPHDLIESLAVPREGFAHPHFVKRTDLREGTLSPSVRNGGTRFQAVYTHDVERELEEQARGFGEDPAAPERIAEHEPPFRHVRPARHAAKLENADRFVQPVRD